MSYKAAFLGWVLGVTLTLAALFGSGGYWQYWIFSGSTISNASAVLLRAINEEGWEFVPASLGPADINFIYLRRPRLHWPP